MALLKDLMVQGPSRFIGNVYGPNFIVNGATSSQFLKGDGSLDSSVYLTQTTLNSGNPDLAAIEALTGTSGFLKKTAANTWTLDTNTYLTTSSASSTYLTQTNANTTYLKKTDASNTYLTQTDASNTYLTKTNASNTYLTQSSASSTYLKKTDASSTYLTQSNAANVYLTKTNASSLYLTQANASSTYAPKASPALTGTPTAPTAATGTNTTLLATTAFVLQELSGIITDIEDNEKVIAAALTDLEDRKANTDDLGLKIISLLENGSTTAGTWLAKTNEITSLVDGQLFYYKIAVAGASTTTLNITNSAGTALGAKTIYIIGTSKLTTHYSVGHYLMLAYNSLNDCFRIVNYYNSDTTLSYGYRDYYYRPVAGLTIYRYKLIALGKDNRMYPIVITDQTSSTQVAKTPTNVGLRPFNIWYHNSTTTISTGNALSGLCVYSAMYLGDTCEYNFNTTIQTYLQVYLRGTYNSVEDLFYLYNDGTSATTSYYTCVPINTANITLSNYFVLGYYYWLVGGSYNSANYMSLFDNNPLYYFDGTNLIPVTTAINNKWYGTEDEFDALTNLDDNTDYYIYDE